MISSVIDSNQTFKWVHSEDVKHSVLVLVLILVLVLAFRNIVFSLETIKKISIIIVTLHYFMLS